jgi:hypothetical protein
MPPKHDIPGLDKKITALSKALANLSSGDDLKKLILLIKKPGWTTPAEFLLVSGFVEHMTVQANALGKMKDTLLRGAGAVSPQG